MMRYHHTQTEGGLILAHSILYPTPTTLTPKTYVPLTVRLRPNPSDPPRPDIKTLSSKTACSLPELLESDCSPFQAEMYTCFKLLFLLSICNFFWTACLEMFSYAFTA